MPPSTMHLLLTNEADGGAPGDTGRLIDATQANPFTGAGGLGSFGGEFYDVRIDNHGMPLEHAKNIPIMGSPPIRPLDYRKMYHGPEFEEGKRGGYAGNRFYDVQVTDTGTPRDIGRAGKNTPLFGKPSAKVVDRSKFYEGREFQANKRVDYGGAFYDVRVTGTGTPRDIALAGRNTPIMGKQIYAPSKLALRPSSAPRLEPPQSQPARPGSAAAAPQRKRPQSAAQPSKRRAGGAPSQRYSASTLTRRGLADGTGPLDAPPRPQSTRSLSVVLSELACATLGAEGTPERAEYFVASRRPSRAPAAASGPVIFRPVWR